MIGRPAALLEHIFIGLVVPEFQASDEGRDRLILQCIGVLPQRLGHRRGGRHIGRAETGVCAPGKIDNASAGAGSAGIFENFPSEPEAPLIRKVVNEIPGKSVPARVLAGLDETGIDLICVIGLKDDGGLGRRLNDGDRTNRQPGADSAALLDALSPRRIHVGGAGMGARAKLATNLVLGLNRAVLAEGFVFAERLGITPATFLELVLATPARSEAALAKGEQMVHGDFGAPQSRIRQHLKDVELMLAGAEALGQRLPLSETHAALLRAAVAAGDGELDNAAIVRQLRREKR